MSALQLAETEWTEWRGDFTGPGIMARISDAGRTMGFWIGPGGYSHSGERIQCYVKGANGRTVMAPELTPEDVRLLAASLLAMADQADKTAQERRGDPSRPARHGARRVTLGYDPA